VSAIAHYLEEQGIATTLIALIRLHVEKGRPPRALWVPFQLGRPVGAPLQPVFQTKVVRSALELLTRDVQCPILVDYPEDEPDSADIESWRAPIHLNVGTVEQEIALLKPWYQHSLANTGRTTVGVSGFDILDAARYLLAIDTDTPIPKPRRDLAEVQCLRYAADDLKAYYLEAISAAGDPPSGWQLAQWFWECTLAGKLLKALREASLGHHDPQRRYAAWWLVPDGFSRVQSVQRMREIAMPNFSELPS